MEVHPPQPLLVHQLPPAPHFVGRQAELDRLHQLWASGAAGIVGLVGLGGAGKTAVAARFLYALLQAGVAPRPDGLIVWSFYQEPDAGRFLDTACRYFARSAGPGARGVGLLASLREAMALGGPHLVILDGLERVQRPDGDAAAAYGQIEDALLKRLLVALAESGGRALVLVTSRFPLADLEAYRGRGYVPVEVGGLGQAAACDLLRARGVWGDDPDLERLVQSYGAHALTLDHLGGLIGQFLGGDARRAPEAPALAAPGGDRQALRLARLLRAYEEHLPPAELALLCRLCLLRRSATAEQITSLFLCSPAIRARTVRELPEHIRQAVGGGYLAVGGDYFEGYELHDLADSIRAAVEGALAESALAGPEETFLHEVIAAVQAFLELREETLDFRVAEIAQLYLKDHLGPATEQRPLSATDQERVRQMCSRYLELAQHPFAAKGRPAIALEKAFQELGYGKAPRATPGDFTPVDVVRGIRRLRARLWHLALKHFTLQRVYELCRLARDKWSLAGPLAPLDRAELLGVLHNLVNRHLVLCESDGSFSVHPAVRDHFARLGPAGERGGWHDLLREQLVSLVRRPGKRLPEDAATLDLAEEAIHHALQAGRTAEAVGLYEYTLGGLRHLGWKLGEMARGVRILRSFDPCPDRWALGWFLQALGEYEEALAHHPLPAFRADVRLLQGRLPEVAAAGDPARTATALFLMGRSTVLPDACLGAAVPRCQLLLYLGRPSQALRSATMARFYADIGCEADRARCLLVMADAGRRQGDLSACRNHLDAAAHWVLHSGSVEHLCLYYLVQARAARAAGDGEAAQRAADAGLHLARQCGLGLYLVELLCEQAEICLARADAVAAQSFAAAALERAQAPACRFLWGAAEAGHLLGVALFRQDHLPEARRILRRALARRRRLRDPKAEETGWVLGLVRQ